MLAAAMNQKTARGQSVCREPTSCEATEPKAIWVKPDQPAAAPVMRASTRDGAGRAVGNGEAVAEGGQRHGEEQGGGGEEAGDGGGEAEEAAADGDEAARHDHPVNAELYGVAAGEEISRHVGHRDGDEPQAVFHGGALQHVHHDVGRAAEEGEEDAGGEAQGERVGAEAAQDEEMAGIAEEILRIGAAGHVGFRAG